MMKNRILNIDGQHYLVLTQNQLCEVDEPDLKLLGKYRWYADKGHNTYYAKTNIKQEDGKRKRLKMHQLLMRTPKGMHTDHINHDGLDNRRENLRVCTASQNQMNSRLRKGSTSKYKGVHWNKSKKRWCVRIKLNGKRKHLGYFTTEQEAALAYNKAAKEHFGKYANLNDFK